MTNQGILSGIKAVAFDLDGVIYTGGTMLPSADIVMRKLEQSETGIFFITNNSTKTRKEIAHKLHSLGIDCSYRNVYSSAYIAGRFLRALEKDDIPVVHVIGSEGLISELKDLGVRIATLESDAQILLVGFDMLFNYQTIVKGFRSLLKGSKFFACNLETRFPVENEQWMPGCAAMVAAIEAVSAKAPDYIIGKPNTYMLELLAREHNLKPEQILVIGDTLETDILMANRFGSPSVLFSSFPQQVSRLPIRGPEFQPTFSVNHHNQLLALLENSGVNIV